MEAKKLQWRVYFNQRCFQRDEDSDNHDDENDKLGKLIRM